MSAEREPTKTSPLGRRPDSSLDRKGRGAGRRGVTVIEFAIIIPLLMMMVFGIVEFGRAYSARLTVTHAAREGVRVLAVTEDQTAAEAAALAAATGIKQEDVTIVATPCNAGFPAEVLVTYPMVIDIPGTGTHSFTLTGRAVMTCLEG